MREYNALFTLLMAEAGIRAAAAALRFYPLASAAAVARTKVNI